MAVWFARQQIQKQREAKAKELWRDYYLLGLQYPDLMTPVSEDFNFSGIETLHGSRTSFLKYEWAVSILLMAVDETFDIKANKRWIDVARVCLGYNIAYLDYRMSIPESWIEHVHPKTKVLIYEILKENRDKRSLDPDEEVVVLRKRARRSKG